MAINNKVIEKVQKLLQTTVDNGASAEESQSAIAMAQRLMAKHNIEARDVELAANHGDVSPIEVDAATGKTLNWWEKVLAVVIADNFRCKTYINGGGSKRAIVFLGEPNDVTIAKSVFGFALSQLEHYAKQYRRKRRAAFKKERGNSNGFDGIAIRNDYMTGYIEGLKAKLREQLDENEEYALIIQTPNSVVKAFSEMSLSSSRVSTRGAGDQHAKASGYEQGQKFASPVGKLN